MSHRISGVYTAIVTPFDKDGNLDWSSYEAILSHQASGGVAGVVVAGTTGESPTLTVQEKLALIRKARAYLPESIQVMAGTGGSCTNSSVEMSKLAVDAGANSLLVVTPPYNKPSLAGLKLHFQSIADSCHHPICLYHVPSRTGQSLSADELEELCRIPEVVAVKEASADLALFGKSCLNSDALYLSGDDASFLPSLAIGGAGVISVLSNIFPKAFCTLYEAYLSGNVDLAQDIHKICLPVIEALFMESNPSPVKAGLAHLGLCQNYFRAPMVPASSETQAHVVRIIQDAEKALKKITKNESPKSSKRGGATHGNKGMAPRL